MILQKRVDDRVIHTRCQIVGNLYLFKSHFYDLCQFCFIKLCQCLKQYLTTFVVDDRSCKKSVDQNLHRILKPLDPLFFHACRFFRSQSLSGRNEKVPVLITQIKFYFAQKILFIKFDQKLTIFDFDLLNRVKKLEDILFAVS